MLRDITLGQYSPADSILHRLDPREICRNDRLCRFPLFVPQLGLSAWNRIPCGDD